MPGPPSKDFVDATAYLVVEGSRPPWAPASQPIWAAKIVAARAKTPAQLSRRQVAVKVTIRLPKAAFEAFSPEAILEVPMELVQRPIVVEAVDPA